MEELVSAMIHKEDHEIVCAFLREILILLCFGMPF
jgi:hypothetical protein